MKTILRIDDTVMAELRCEAARQNRSISEMVETALRLFLRSSKRAETLPALPTFRSGGTLADIASRDVLYRVMEGQ
ncbi:MAG: ribbon-helix-helix protein, CopG family [Terriglobales bacterium]